MNPRYLPLLLLSAILSFFTLQKSQACGYAYVSDCATTINIEMDGVTSGFQVSSCPYLTVFDNHGFGTVTSLSITHLKSITWESCNNNVFNARLFYRIYKQTASPGSFNSIELTQLSTNAAGSYRTKTREEQPNLDLLSGLSSGDYFVDIYFESDVNFNNGNTSADEVLTKNNGGNYYTASFSVDNGQSGTLNVALSNQQDVSCNGNSDGSASVNATNGTAPITYLWSNGTIGSSVSGLSAGIYSVTATDALGETGTLNVNIFQPPVLQANLSSTNESSSSANNGTASAQPFGGTPPYTYVWSNGATAASLNNLDSGSYSVTVTDDNGCTVTGTALIIVSGDISTNYCTSEGNFPWVDWITNVNFNTINNASGKSKYSDFTNLSTELSTGSDYTVTIENGFSWQTYDEYFKVWIDYDRNGSFEEPGEIAFQGFVAAPPIGTPTAQITGTINIPSTADEGPTRMRVAIKRGDFPSPCEMIPFGEVEDYSINIVNGGPVTCSISSNVTNLICDDNNTPLDPVDDLYGFDLLVNGNGTGANWMAMINAQLYNGDYGVPLSLGGISISAGALSFTIIDTDSSTCSVVQNVTPPPPCSNVNPCTISAQMSTPICNDNGTSSDPSDDTYTFNLTATGNNAGTGWSTNVLGQLQSGSYGVTTLMGPYPINQGVQDIVIDDLDNAGCNTGITINPPATCSNGGGGITYCASTSTFPWHDWIAGVVLENIDNPSNKTPYSDFTSLSANVTAGNSYPIVLTSGFSWFTYNEHWKVWIDYNQDGQFQEPDEIAFSLSEPAPPNGTNEHTVNGTINIPPTALAGPTRMRIAMKRNANPAPCEGLPFGEVEDYTINIGNNLNGGGSENFLVLNLEGTPGAGYVDLYALVKTSVEHGSWELEKSGDNLLFETIRSGETDGSNSLLVHEQDYDPNDGQNHYRISFYDQNGSLLLRKNTIVPFEHVATFDLFPNPASSAFSIQFSELIGKKVRVDIYNQLGQPVYRDILQEVIDPIYQIQMPDWRDGLYQVMIFPEGRRMVSKQLIVDKM